MEGEYELLGHIAKSIRAALQDSYASLRELALTLEAQENESMQRQTGVMAQGIFRLERLSSNLELYRRLAAERYTLQARRTEVPLFLEALCTQAEDLLSYAGLHLDVSLPEKRFYGNLDRYLTEQIFWNLLSNAAGAAQDGRLRLTARHEGKYLRLTVEEQTDRLPEDVLSTFFDRSRVALEASLAQQGVGLGLPLIRLAAEAHGGSVLVFQSPEGSLSVVAALDLTLPQAENVTEVEYLVPGLQPGLTGLSGVLPPSAFDSREIF